MRPTGIGGILPRRPDGGALGQPAPDDLPRLRTEARLGGPGEHRPCHLSRPASYRYGHGQRGHEPRPGEEATPAGCAAQQWSCGPGTVSSPDRQRIVFFGGYGDDGDRLVVCAATGSGVEPVRTTRAVRPDGGRLGRRHVVGRGERVYVLEEPYTEWYVLDAGATLPATL
ncbi:hypothetical protein [Streptomyces wuyuanensis]|uniref:hypothetical protein n=1 Tax=Streptomyces wuyuanensis TaxID=1196353 RepID=UPI003416B575